MKKGGVGGGRGVRVVQGAGSVHLPSGGDGSREDTLDHYLISYLLMSHGDVGGFQSGSVGPFVFLGLITSHQLSAKQNRGFREGK